VRRFRGIVTDFLGTSYRTPENRATGDIDTLEQLARRSRGSFDLPQRAAAIVPECVERADLGQRREFIATKTCSRD
jgi:hypothetical protein